MTQLVFQDGTFIAFASVAEQIARATDPGEKIGLLEQYLLPLRDDHLMHAVRYATGHAFPLREHSSTQISEVLLISALSILSGSEPAQISQQRQQLGSLPEVAAALLPDLPEPLLMLEDVAIAVEQLSKAKGKRKLNWLIQLLERTTPLEAKYVLRILAGDLHIGLTEEAVEAAVAQISEQPLEQIQWVHTLVGDLGKTALLARHDHLNQARLQLFQPIKFMLAGVIPDLAQLLHHLSQGFAIEPKYNGLRVQAHIAPANSPQTLTEGTVCAGIRVALFSRTLQEITAQFPDLIAPLAALKPRALVTGETAGLILDGEIVPYLDGRILPFSALQRRLGEAVPSATMLAAVPVAFIAYDVLYQDGEVLINQSYLRRREMLEALPLETQQVQIASAQRFSHQSAVESTVLEQAYTQIRDQGQEGLMVKTLQSFYRPGRRSQDWLKIKQLITTLDVVITAVEVDATIDPVYFSVYAIAIRRSATDSTLLNLGKVVAESSDQRKALADWFHHHTLEEFAEGRVCLVEPQIVMEVTCEQFQPSTRYKSGYRLEEARIVRIRHDKSVEEIDTLETVSQIADVQSSNWWDSHL